MNHTRQIISIGGHLVTPKGTLVVYPYPHWNPEAACLASVTLHGPEKLDLQKMKDLFERLSKGEQSETLNIPLVRMDSFPLNPQNRDPRVDLARLTWVADERGRMRCHEEWLQMVVEHLERLKVSFDLAIAEQTTA